MFLPGVPEEVHAMTAGFIIPYIRSEAGISQIIKSRTLKVFGLWESKIQELLSGHLPDLPFCCAWFLSELSRGKPENNRPGHAGAAG